MVCGDLILIHKMNPIELLKQEHRDIERELIELESIIKEEVINYPNLVHVIKKLCEIWDEHEQKEEKIFPIMEKEKIKIPVYTMLCEHRDLKGHKDAIKDAIESGSEFKLKKALNEHGKIIITKLRKHINDEDEVLYTITLQEFTPKELEELWESVN